MRRQLENPRDFLSGFPRKRTLSFRYAEIRTNRSRTARRVAPSPARVGVRPRHRPLRRARPRHRAPDLLRRLPGSGSLTAHLHSLGAQGGLARLVPVPRRLAPPQRIAAGEKPPARQAPRTTQTRTARHGNPSSVPRRIVAGNPARTRRVARRSIRQGPRGPAASLLPGAQRPRGRRNPRHRHRCCAKTHRPRHRAPACQTPPPRLQGRRIARRHHARWFHRRRAGCGAGGFPARLESHRRGSRGHGRCFNHHRIVHRHENHLRCRAARRVVSCRSLDRQPAAFHCEAGTTKLLVGNPPRRRIQPFKSIRSGKNDEDTRTY